jgi:HlyD family secretion protein
MPSSALDPRSHAETLARIAAAEAAQASAEQRARAAAADLAHAESELARAQSLHEDGIIPREQLEHAETEASRARANHRSAQAAVDVARFELEGARAALQYSDAAGKQGGDRTITVRSPVEGRILRVVHESEGVVQAGEALLEIGNPQALEIEVEVLSSDAVRVAPGTKVFFERWGGNGALEGRVRTVEPVGFTKVSALGVEEQRVRVIAEFVSDPEQWGRLADSYRVEARFLLWEGENILQVPSSALFRYGQNWAVFVMHEGRAQRRIVEVGHQGESATEVASGLSEGDVVILHPESNLEDGSKVELRDASPKSQ